MADIHKQEAEGSTTSLLIIFCWWKQSLGPFGSPWLFPAFPFIIMGLIASESISAHLTNPQHLRAAVSARGQQ